MKYIAKTLFGLETVLSQELEQIGAQNIEVLKRAVAFEGDLEVLYRANLELRTALRILHPIKQFRAQNDNQLYNKAYKFNWSNYLSTQQTFAIDAVVNSDHFRHSKFAALRLKDAIVDQFRKHTNRRPTVDTRFPHVRFHLHISGDRITISLDSSGESLHKRGYRGRSLVAPINEVLAAGMVLLSGWQADCDFLDPMCGSGTIAIEAALFAHGMAPNLFRHDFGFQNWPDFDSALWSRVLQQAREKVRTFQHNIMAYDKDFKAVRATEQNAEAAGLEGKIDIQRQRFEKLEAPSRLPCLLMTNPPYDERLQQFDIGDFYQLMGDQFKQNFSGCEAWIISSNLAALKKVGLRPSSKTILFNGALECRLVQYQLYKGSVKNKAPKKTQKEE
ncbi:MAG: THUMP domain-containing protein [Bacteroidota bacterium]